MYVVHVYIKLTRKISPKYRIGRVGLSGNPEFAINAYLQRRGSSQPLFVVSFLCLFCDLHLAFTVSSEVLN